MYRVLCCLKSETRECSVVPGPPRLTHHASIFCPSKILACNCCVSFRLDTHVPLPRLGRVKEAAVGSAAGQYNSFRGVRTASHERKRR